MTVTRRAFALALVATFAVGTLMRVAWLRADPPVVDAVGVVWHDEGAWVHNARNRALFGTWRTDAWNPVFVAPVFTALEYESFRAFGVGVWQARVVPVVSGLAAIACLVAGLFALGGRRAAAIGGALLATNYGFVMWNRAALMESTLTAGLVAAWAAYAMADRRAWWGVVAGAAAVGAWFTKASAAFFLAALVLDAGVTILQARLHASADASARIRARAAWLTLAGLAAAGAIVAALFVLPHWSEYRFYNWQMSVTRKPEYSVRALMDRASWLPLVQGIFSRMWLVLAAGAAGIVAVVLRWRDARPAERLLVLWVFIGLLELVVHDSGNERRYVMFIPALTALAALWISGAGTGRADPLSRMSTRVRVGLAAVCLPLAYLVVGCLVRPLWLADIDAGHLKMAVRVSAVAAVLIAGVAGVAGPALGRALGGRRLPAGLATAWVLIVLAWNGVEYGMWTRHRAAVNYEASVALGRLLPAGTVVQGKLANGLALENRIRPLFVGNGFGNYEDRLQREDARYILTYDLPRLGYESSDGSGLIQGILDHYPQHRTIATFPVDETPGPDRAVLIDKVPDSTPHARD
jgi:hypothetical protein